ncbi:MAG: hypothetical protein AABX77_00925 [Nanoarchaeota archaeon]
MKLRNYEARKNELLVRFGFVNQKNDCMVVGKIRSYQELVDKQLPKYSKRGTG